MNIYETGKLVLASGTDKVKTKGLLLILKGILAGICISLSAIGYLKVLSHANDMGVGYFLASAIFPMGIVAIILLKAELFTSDCLITIGLFEKRYGVASVLRVLFLVWLGNMIGMVIMAWITTLSWVFDNKMIETIIQIGLRKISMPITHLIASAILCNIIVCLAVWLAYTVEKPLNQMIILWFTVTVFALSGTEHIVLNMYYLSTAVFLRAGFPMLRIMYSIVAVTVGNIIGGSIIFVGMVRGMTALE